MDFTEDCLASGRKFRTASLKDDGTRACPAILVDPALPGWRVVGMLDQAAGERGCPDMPVVDNGPEFRGRELERRAPEPGVKLFLIDPGQPMPNASIERFHGRGREECLDQSWFTSLTEARRIIEAWRAASHGQRPRTSLRMATSAAVAAARPFVGRQRASALEVGEARPCRRRPLPTSRQRCYRPATDAPDARPYHGGRVK